MTGRLGDLYSGGGRGGEFTTRFRGGPLTVKKHDLLEEEFVTWYNDSNGECVHQWLTITYIQMTQEGGKEGSSTLS